MLHKVSEKGDLRVVALRIAGRQRAHLYLCGAVSYFHEFETGLVGVMNADLLRTGAEHRP